MNRNGVIAVLCAILWILSACSTPEFGFERDGQEIEFVERDGQEIEFERDGRDYIESTRQKYEVDPGGTLAIVAAELGSIHIRSSINNEVDVLVRKRLRETDADRVRKAFSNVEVEIKETYNGVRIEVDQIRNVTYKRWFWQDWPDRVTVDIEVLVPVEYNLDLSTIIGDIQTGNIAGNVTAKTLSGNVSTGPTEGDLSIKTNSGNIETGRVVGKVHTITLSGNTEVIGPVDGDVTIRSNSGRIETRTIDGDLQAKSLTGRIKIGPVDGDATVHSNSGDIRTGNVQGKLKATTLIGNITNR
ncbi:MAG: DUF4097 family beta strand repeat-containing protein [Gemmatimonadota bacterium]|nr:DUF4097 family beta strand repeat-containing protein [Gemmatimonadota bacterium]